MFLPTASILLSLFPAAFSNPSHPQHILSNPASPSTYQIPTRHESAILARRLLNLSSIATVSSVFPSSNENTISQDQDAQWTTPNDLSGAPIGLMEYYASCSPQPSNPTILAITIATTFKNSRAGSNVTLSLRWHPPPTAPPSDDIYTYSPANMPRISLIGYIEHISADEVEDEGVKECFLKRHDDAEAWAPGNDIHESWWARLVVREVFFFGGFGDRAYIGWILGSEWKGVTEEEVHRARLVGEEGYESYRAKQLERVEEL